MQTLIIAAVLVMGFGLDSAQSSQPPDRQPELPTMAKLSEVEIHLTYRTSGGCLGRCVAYRVAIRGDGSVEYEDIGGEPRDPPRRRSVAVDEVVSLVNEFLHARFVDARSVYGDLPIADRQGDSLRFLSQGACDLPESTLTLGLAAWTKTVRLNFGYPKDYARLPVLVELLGGPSAWK
jgi:hypothetical protein